MNISQCKDRTLMLLDEMKVGKTSRTEYLKKFYDYADMAQKKCIQVKPIVKIYNITKVEGIDKYSYYDLPTDFKKLRNVYNSDLETVKYIYMPNKQIALDDSLSGIIKVEYEAYPTTITASILDTYEFEVSEDVCQAIPFYISALSVSKEDDKRPYDTNMEQFDSIMMNLDTEMQKAPITVKINKKLFI